MLISVPKQLVFLVIKQPTDFATVLQFSSRYAIIMILKIIRRKVKEMQYPFGEKVHRLVQEDRSPKRVFVLGVYASAVHAKWKWIVNPKLYKNYLVKESVLYKLIH